MQIHHLTTRGELEALRDAWTALWDRCANPTPFQTPEWVLPWWDLLGRGRLAALAFFAADRLVGLAPLFTDAAGTLRFLGEGISDYLDVLAEPGREPEVTRVVLDHLALSGRRWNFPDLPQSSALLTPGLAVQVSAVCPVLALPDSVETWQAGLPPGLRNNLRRYRRLAGTIEIATRRTLPEFLEALFRLHRERWAQRSGAGVLADAAVCEFHRRAAAGLLDRGILRFYGLRVRGGLAAVLYAFACRSRVFLYLSGFDPALARMSPGTVLLGAAIEEAIVSGRREADFLRGDEAYKYRWGARNRNNFQWRGGGAQPAA